MQIHRGLGNLVVDQELIVAASDNVDDSIANGQYIETSHQKVGPGIGDSRYPVLAVFPKFGRKIGILSGNLISASHLSVTFHL